MRAAARAATRHAQSAIRALAGSSAGTRILCYHLVGAGSASAVDIDLAVFRQHLEALASVPLHTVSAVAQRLVTGHDGAAVALTFDDAFLNFYETVWPELERTRTPATLFVPVDFVRGQAGPPLSGVDFPACSWRELREMASNGFLEIGSHTLTHPDLRSLPIHQLRDELARSREMLEDRLGVAVDAFCYPRALWSDAVEREVGRVYRYAVVGGGRRLLPGKSNPLRLSRTSVRRDSPLPVTHWLEAPVWLEEALADFWRRSRR